MLTEIDCRLRTNEQVMEKMHKRQGASEKSKALYLSTCEVAMTSFQTRVLGHIDKKLKKKPSVSESCDVRLDPPPAWQNSTANESY